MSVTLQLALQSEGHHVQVATEPEAGLERAIRGSFEVVIIDLYWDLPGTKRCEEKGLALTEQLHRLKPQLPIIILTAFPDPGTIIEATKLGALDYFTKPGTEEEMDNLVNAIVKAAESARKDANPPRAAASLPTSRALMASGPAVLVGRSRAMQTVYMEIGRVAAKPMTVLIRGDTGTGKGLVARALHEYSGRGREKFILVNSANITDVELFGHENGAFGRTSKRRLGRFEQANGGTIFLDEIGEMNLDVQKKLLRVLQEKTIQRIGSHETFPIDVRVIASTKHDMDAAMQEKRFRSDLYYRLNDAVIRLPQLRERLEDIPFLVRHFLQRFAPESGASRPTITEDAIKLLQQQSWPGHVGELENVIHRALGLARGLTITTDTIKAARDQIGHVGPNAIPPAEPFPNQRLADFISQLLDKAESGQIENVAAVVIRAAKKEMRQQAIREAKGSYVRAAEWLGVPADELAYEQLSQASQSRDTEVQTGMHLYGYTFLRRIGKGGFGEVWLARSSAGDYRAIKVLYGTPSQKEFKAIRKYEPIPPHDGLVRIVDEGIGGESPFLYYVMELADDRETGRKINPLQYAAKTLKSELEQHCRFSPSRCVSICLSLLAPLQHLNSHNLVHRDIKPANIIFVDGKPKLGDISLLTTIGGTTFAGTPPYLAPEGPGEPTADIYGLGIVLYEMMTGKSGDDCPSIPRNVATSNTPLFMQLFRVMEKATAQNARRRYQSAREMRDALAPLREGPPPRS